MQYKVVRSLQTRDAVDPGADVAVDGTLLVADRPVAKWQQDHSRYGYDSCSLTPAFHNGAQAWVLSQSWCAESPYSASGTQDLILDFEAGVKRICELDLWDGIFSATQESVAA